MMSGHAATAQKPKSASGFTKTAYEMEEEY